MSLFRGAWYDAAGVPIGTALPVIVPRPTGASAGTGSATLDDATGAGGGTVMPLPTTGAGAATLDDATGAGSGTAMSPPTTGAGAATLDDATSAGSGAVADPINTPAPTLSRTSPALTSPPALRATFGGATVERPQMLVPGDTLAIEYSTATNFGGSTVSRQAIGSGDITTGSKAGFGWGALSTAAPVYWRCWVERAGVRVSDISNVVSSFDTAAPSISSSLLPSIAERALLDHQLAANKPMAAWRIVGGDDASLFMIVGNRLRWAGDVPRDFETPTDANANNVYLVDIEGEDVGGNRATFAHQVAVTDVSDTFVNPGLINVASAVEGQPYSTSFQAPAATVDGIVFTATFTGPMTVKRNGVVVASPFTFVKADTIAIEGVGPAANVVTAQSFVVDGVAFGWQIAGVLTLPAAASIGARFEPSDLATLFQLIAGTMPVTTDGQPVGYLGDKSANARHLTAAADDTTRPTFRQSGSLRWVEFDGVNDALRNALPHLYAAGSFTLVLAGRGLNDPVGYKQVLGEFNSADADTVFAPLTFTNNTTQDAGAWLRNDAGVQQIANTALFDGDAFDGADTVITIVWTGTQLQFWEDAQVSAATLAFAPVAPMTINRFALGARVGPSTLNHAPIRCSLLITWPGVQLDVAQRAQAVTYAGATQGRSL